MNEGEFIHGSGAEACVCSGDRRTPGAEVEKGGNGPEVLRVLGKNGVCSSCCPSEGTELVLTQQATAGGSRQTPVLEAEETWLGARMQPVCGGAGWEASGLPCAGSRLFNYTLVT